MSSLASIEDINLKIFDEICEERFSNLELDVILVSIIDNLPSDALPHLAEQYHITGMRAGCNVEMMMKKGI